MNFEQARFNMVEQQIRPWEVLDSRVLDLLEKIQREDFVPVRYRKLAFADIAIPLEFGQVMMRPKIEARLLQALDLQEDESVLEIGTGSGYQAAVTGSGTWTEPISEAPFWNYGLLAQAAKNSRDRTQVIGPMDFIVL